MVPDPVPGKHTIQLAPPHELKVGVNRNAALPRHVVAFGDINHFLFQWGGDNRYIISLRDEVGKTLVVTASADNRVIADVPGPPAIWIITKQASGHYTIQLPNSNLGWTLERFNPGDPVILVPVPEVPVDVQLWDLPLLK